MSAPNMKSVEVDFVTRLKTKEQADAWVESLVLSGQDFHFDDDPAEIRIFRGTANVDCGALFTDSECKHLRARLDELFALLKDPFEPLVRHTKKHGRKETPYSGAFQREEP